MVVDAGVFAFPEAFFHSGFVGLFEAWIEGGIDVVEAAEVDVVCELVDEDAFGLVGVAGVAEDVFFGTGADGIGGAAAGAASACVPVFLAGEFFEAGHGLEGHAGEFGEVGGEFVVGHDAEACSAEGHGIEDVRAVCEHEVADECGFLEGVGVDVL